MPPSLESAVATNALLPPPHANIRCRCLSEVLLLPPHINIWHHLAHALFFAAVAAPQQAFAYHSCHPPIMFANKTNGSYVHPLRCSLPQQDKSFRGEAPKSGWQSLPGWTPQDSYLHVAEWWGHEGSLVDAVKLPKEIPLFPHVQAMDSSISGRREFSPGAGFGQFLLNTWGSRARPCKPGGVSDGTPKGIHWWSAHLGSQSQPCKSPVLSIPKLLGRALTWSLLEGCLYNFWLGLLTRQPLQASWVLESRFSWWGSWGEYTGSYRYR